MTAKTDTKKVEIDTSNSVFADKNLGTAVPYAFYNALNIKKTLRYIASRENVEFDLNSVVRFLVCDSIVDLDRKAPVEQKINSHFIQCKLNKQIINDTIKLMSKYQKTILSSVNNSFYNLGLKSDVNIGILSLINNYIPNNNFLVYNKPYIKNFLNNDYKFTGVYSDFWGLSNKINFSENFLNTNNSARKLKTLANNLGYDHFCVIGKYIDIDDNVMARLIHYGQTFCINTLSNCPLYNKKIHDWIVDENEQGKKIFDGYIKERNIFCNLPSANSNNKNTVKLRLVCARSHNLRAEHKRYVNINESDEGWFCFLTNEENLSDFHIIHKRYLNYIGRNIYSLFRADFFSHPLLSNEPSDILGYFTIFGISQDIINVIRLMTGYPSDFARLSRELKRYTLRYIDNKVWINKEITDFGKTLFSLIGKTPKKFLNNDEIKLFFMQNDNADIVKNKIFKFVENFKHMKL